MGISGVSEGLGERPIHRSRPSCNNPFHTTGGLPHWQSSQLDMESEQREQLEILIPNKVSSSYLHWQR